MTSGARERGGIARAGTNATSTSGGRGVRYASDAGAIESGMDGAGVAASRRASMEMQVAVLQHGIAGAAEREP